jgi:hypothetical protein
MIEFMLKDRRMRLIDGVFHSRAIWRGQETRNETWNKVSFYDCKGYLRCDLTVNKVKHKLLQHRLVWYAHHQDWDIWDTSRDNLIDHINQNKKDNRIGNLRPATNAENQQNQDCKGCYFVEALNKWMARITVNGKREYIGLYDTEQEAHEAYLAKKRILHSHFVEEEEL